MRPASLALTAALSLLALSAVPAAAPAATPSKWLCKPGQTPNPCVSSLTATVIGADNARTTERTAIARRAPVDCFYVYPTVSGQPTANATLVADPEQRAIAAYQASRFSQRCRVHAPLYRQLTLASILDPKLSTQAARLKAYGDVRDAWREYLRRDNRGRGVALLGHSQGSFMLRQLITEEIDPKPAARRRLVSALLLGGNVTVRKGRDVGGDFRNVRACRSATQLGCVVAYSTFDATPPENALFGRVGGRGATTEPGDAAGLEVLCTNPAALGGGSGDLDGYVRTDPFPGALGAALQIATGGLPTAPTPWIKFPGRYTARCANAGGASWLQVTPRPDDVRLALKPSPTPEWGLHLGDVNLAQGQLVDLVRRQAAAYVARRG